MKEQVVLGIDIGGTNTDFGFVNSGGDIIVRKHHSTNEYEQFEDFIESLHLEVTKLVDEHNFDLVGIGVGAPNGNYYNGTIEYAPNLKWKNIIPVTKLFVEYFKVPTFLTNDANAATLGEMLFGGAKNYKDFIYITLGTGVGSGIVVNGNLVYGHDGFAGEVGHIIAEEQGRQCGCGRKGCLETYSSVSGLKKSVQLLMNDQSLLKNQSTEKLTGKIIYEAAKKGDLIALKAFEIAAEKLGKVLANVTAVTSPKAIFLFGGLANAESLIFDQTKKFMEENLLEIYKNKVQILPSELAGNDAAIKGSAALTWNEIT